MAPRKRPWFRFYVEMIWDRKIRRLPVTTRWLWVSLLACARSSPVPGVLLLTEGDPMTDGDIADAAALSPREVRKGIESLTKLGLIDNDTNTCALFVVRWNERQFESDDTSLRTAKHRSKERSMERSKDGDVTHQIQKQKTDTETEADIELSSTSPVQQSPRQVTALANSHLEPLIPKLSEGSGYDLLHEFKELWPVAWQDALDKGLNPKAVGIQILGRFIATVTDTEPDYGRAGQLVGRFGKLSLLGIDEGLMANADDPYRYAFRVCQNKAQESRAGVTA